MGKMILSKPLKDADHCPCYACCGGAAKGSVDVSICAVGTGLTSLS